MNQLEPMQISLRLSSISYYANTFQSVTYVKLVHRACELSHRLYKTATVFSIMQTFMNNFSVPASVNIVPEKSPYNVDLGTSIQLTCYPSGNPVPTIVWTRVVRHVNSN